MTNNQVLDDMHKKGCAPCCKGISWSAILAGAFVAIGLSFLLYAFGTAIGLSAFTVTDNITSVAIGGFVAMLFGSIVAMFVSGWVAGYLNRRCCHENCTGALSGFLAWSVAIIITALITAQLGQLLTVNYTTVSTAPTANIRITPSIYGEITPSAKGNAIAEHAKSGESRAIAHEEKLVSNVSKALFLTFLLFFVGALASAIGGHCGMMGCRKHELKDREVGRH